MSTGIAAVLANGTALLMLGALGLLAALSVYWRLTAK